jgi:hypothetical protein
MAVSVSNHVPNYIIKYKKSIKFHTTGIDFKMTGQFYVFVEKSIFFLKNIRISQFSETLTAKILTYTTNNTSKPFLALRLKFKN